MYLKIVGLFSKIFLYTASACLFVITFLIGADVFLRYTFNAPIPGTLEISEVIPVILTYFGFAFTAIHKRHIRTTFALDWIQSASIRSVMEVIVSALMLFFISILIWRTSIEGLAAWHIKEYTQGVIAVPTYPIKLLMPAALLAGWLYYMWEIVQILQGKEYTK